MTPPETADLFDPSPRRRRKAVQSGKLRIGDQWNAITIIARSQTHVLKAVCELVENSIDAGAGRIDISRRKRERHDFLEVADNGRGLRINEDGVPDFKYVATHICDSIKRYLKDHDKAGVHGEFGIGLLGFWSLGRELHMYAGDGKGRFYQMVMKSGSQSYSVLPCHGHLFDAGVRIVIGPLHPTTRNVLTCERLEKYLANELRDRIRNTGVDIEIHDRISRKTRRVVPRTFEGDRLDGFPPIETPFGRISMELYLAAPKKDAPPLISFSKDGTRVKRSMAELENFDDPVWSSPFLEGNIDCPFVDLTPGTRDSVIHNNRFEAFISAMLGVREQLAAVIEARKRAEDDRASSVVSRDVRKALSTVLAELPQDEYVWFDVEKPDPTKTGSADGAEPQDMGPDPEEAAIERRKKLKPGAMMTFLEDIPGEAATCRLFPRIFSIECGGRRNLAARVFDERGIEVRSDLAFEWCLVSGGGCVTPDVLAGRASFTAPAEPGNAVIRILVRTGDNTLSAEARARILAPEEMEAGISMGRGLPNYRLTADFAGAWRSRYLPRPNLIEINSGHKDFLATRDILAEHKRYVAKLYAKEIVMLNFPGTSQEQSLECIIEILVRMEKLL